MVNYSNGKIYKIEPMCEHDEGDIYIGSTTKQYLSQRMDTHRNDYKCWLKGIRGRVTSFRLFEKYGVENCQIILLEDVDAKSKDELIARESYYIRKLKCINKVIPDRTAEEYYQKNRERAKEYYQNNKEKVKEYYQNNKEKVKEYYQGKREQIIEKSKEYRKNNPDYFKEYYQNNQERIKGYYQNNKEKVKEYRQSKREQMKEYMKTYNKLNKKCDICDCVVRRCAFTIHTKTKKHQNNLKMISDKPILTTMKAVNYTPNDEDDEN